MTIDLGRNESMIEDNPKLGLNPLADPYESTQTKREDDAGAMGG